MAVVSRTATIQIRNIALGGTRTWQATAAVQDTAAGGSVVVTVTDTTAGTGAPGNEASFTLRYVDDAGTIIRTVTLDTAAASQTNTFFFTTDGTSGGSARMDTIEIKLQVTSGVNYDVETDGSPSSVAAGFEVSQLDRGWIRGTTTLVEGISNIALGGAQTEPADYDESLFARLTLGHTGYIARALTVALSAGSVSGSTNSTTSTTRDVTFSNVCDERFPAAVTDVGMTVTVPNATLTGMAAFAFSSTTDASIDVDPRLTCTHHFQTDDDVFGLSKDDNTNQMLSTQQGYLWTIIKNARSDGVNSLTVSQTLDPVSAGTTISGSGSTSTQDGQVGVSARLDWTASKPGGTWNKTVDITAPTDIDADTHLLNSTDVYTLLAVDPRIRVVVYLGQSGSSNSGRHLEPGDSLKATVTAFSTETRKRLTPDAGSVKLTLIRWNEDLDRFEFVEADGATWSNWAGTATAAVSMTMADAGDGVTFITSLTTTSGWGLKDIVAVNAVLKVNGTPYTEYTPREMVGSKNRHDISRYLSVGEV